MSEPTFIYVLCLVVTAILYLTSLTIPTSSSSLSSSPNLRSRLNNTYILEEQKIDEENSISSSRSSDILDVDDGEGDIDVAVIAVASMQRSSSTYTTNNLLTGSPCYVNLNEIFFPNPKQSGNAWEVDGKDVQLNNGTQLAEFVKRVGRHSCEQQWEWMAQISSAKSGTETTSSDFKQQCQNKCIVGYKHFDVHLKNHQVDEEVWKELQPNLVTVVLERNPEERWRSAKYAEMKNDWTVDGNAEHKAEVQNAELPPISDEFLKTHNDWYSFVRSTIEDDERRVDIQFEETTQNGPMVANRINQALPEEFRDLLFIKYEYWSSYYK